MHDSSMASKRRDAPNLPVDPEEETLREPAKRHDPTEIRIYIKCLRRALRYIPIGSRAYYYLEGELLRANKMLRTSVTVDPAPKGAQQ